MPLSSSQQKRMQVQVDVLFLKNQGKKPQHSPRVQNGLKKNQETYRLQPAGLDVQPGPHRTI